jgi:hypothetical protein
MQSNSFHSGVNKRGQADVRRCVLKRTKTYQNTMKTKKQFRRQFVLKGYLLL